jgi:hypothetical protein
LQPVANGDVVARLDRIDVQLTALAAIIGADGLVVALPPAQTATAEPAAGPEPAVAAEPSAVPVPDAAVEPAPDTAIETAVAGATAEPDWRDEASYTLAPGEGIEVKLAMDKGQTALFFWTANGSVVNYGTHGDGGGEKIGYEQGHGVGEQSGELTAAFTGNHGWFWRNRTDAPVTITPRTAGNYAEMKRP